jgi:deoxyribodipyrimidine photo-lyase
MALSITPPPTHSRPASLVWLRRDLRLYDHAALSHALASSKSVWFVFVFDTTILGTLKDSKSTAKIHGMKTLTPILAPKKKVATVYPTLD